MNQPIVFCLSGWAQNPNSLDPLFAKHSNNYQIINFDYSKFADIESCLLAIKNLRINPKIVVGWSLGGQIAVRLISKKIFAPQLLILIATPFQFVKFAPPSPINDDFVLPAAMPQTTFATFRQNFLQHSAKTLEKFSVLMMMNDKKRAQELAKNLYIDEENYANLAFWLDELGSFSCRDLDFSQFPKTIIYHGQEDLVVHSSQAKIFADRIANSELHIIANCGHCPHISHLSQLCQFPSLK